MADLPDEVLIDRRMHAWRPDSWHVLDRREGQVRYVRGDLYEHAQHERDALADNQRCITCGGTGVDVEYGEYGAQLGSDWCDSCDAGKALRELGERAEQAEAERDALRQQAEGWAQEARTQRATVHECYQACTGAAGEPGDWHGAEPVRAVVAERDRLRAALAEIEAERDVLREAVERLSELPWWRVKTEQEARHG